MVSSARVSIVAVICYSIYAFASVPFWNSETTIVGPLVRIAVFSSWIGLARTLARAQESFTLRQGIIGSTLPVVLLISVVVFFSIALSPRAPQVSSLSFLEVLAEIVVAFCSIAAYSFVCGMFAAVPMSVAGALFISGLVLVVQIVVDWCFGGVGAYGPPLKFHI